MSRLTYANVASTLALVLVLGGGGTAVAATALAKNSVGSKQIKAGAVKNPDLAKSAVTSAKVKDNSLTGADVLESSLGEVPAAAEASHAAAADSATKADSATNADHATTADSATSAVRASNLHSGVVESDGTLVPGQSLDAVSASRLAIGQYQLVFDRNVSSCTFVGSITEPGIGSPETGAVGTTGRSGNANAVFVATRDSAGAYADRAFAVVVVC